MSFYAFFVFCCYLVELFASAFCVLGECLFIVCLYTLLAIIRACYFEFASVFSQIWLVHFS